MATSGTLNGNAVIVVSNKTARLRIQWQLVSQSISGNSSRINWQAFVDFIGCDAQLDNGHVNWNGGALYNNNGRVYNYQANFANHSVSLGSGAFTLGHNSIGNATLNMNGSCAVFQSGTTAGSASWGLPQIPRFADITSFTVSALTDEAFNVNVSVSDTCDLLQYSLNGAGWVNAFVGNFTAKTFQLAGLVSGQPYTIRVRVRRSDSQLLTESGTIGVTTLVQNRFFKERVP